MKRILLPVLVVVGFLAVAALAAQNAPRPPVDYDSFWTLDLQARLRVFNEVTPENRAALFREHLTRWIDANRARLSAEQLKVLDEDVASITPDLYRLPRQPEVAARVKQLETKTAAVLSREDIGAAMTVYGDRIPKKQ